MAHPDQVKSAQNALSALKGDKPLSTLVDALDGQFSKGYLSAVLRGVRPAYPRLQKALGVRKVYKRHPVMRHDRINRAMQQNRPVVIRGDARRVCLEDKGGDVCFDTLADLIAWLAPLR